jgi:imidazolonepropionase-like amidohydrolase
VLSALALLAVGCVPYQDAPVQAFVNARILPVSAPVIERGVLLVQNGKILAVGPAASTPVPRGASVTDLAGKTLVPGFVDTHSHIGGGGGGDRSGPVHPDARIYDAINPLDSGFKSALAGGITSINIMPGSGHLMSGQTLYVKNRLGRTIDDVSYRFPDGAPMGGMKMANGTNPIGSPPFPGTRGRSMALVRELFLKAQTYRQKAADGGESPARKDLGMEAMLEVLDGKRIVHHHTHRADDIASVLRLQREFGFRVVLHHVSEAWLMADEIAAAGVPSSIIAIDAPGGKHEAVNVSFMNGVALEKRGASVAVHTDDGITDSRLFLRSAAMFVRGGMSRDGALRALTLEGAKMMDLQDRVGTLSTGKDADFVVLSGDPFSVYTLVLQTWVEGRKLFDRDRPADRLLAVGGYGAGQQRQPYLCCQEAQK